MTLGGIFFYFSESSVLFPFVGETPVWKLILVMLIGYTLIPVPLSLDIHGWGEMHPLNGPAWSLFYEYVGNILYALFLRKNLNDGIKHIGAPIRSIPCLLHHKQPAG